MRAKSSSIYCLEYILVNFFLNYRKCLWLTRKGLSTKGDITKESDGYIHKSTNPSGVSYNPIQLFHALVIDTLEHFKKLPDRGKFIVF